MTDNGATSHTLKKTESAQFPNRAESRGNTYYVLRHGEAEQNVLGIVYGREDDNYALTSAGEDQVKAAVEKLKGGSPERIQNIQPTLVTRENMDTPEIQAKINPNLDKYLK